MVALEAVDSTNDEARRYLKGGAAPGLVVCARRQHRGRGRRGAAWHGVEGNLFCSVLLAPVLPVADFGQLSFAAALAVGDAVAVALPAGVRVAFKWPNDVLVEGRKVAGILLESEGTPGGDAPHVIVGIGVNVAAAPEGLDQPATALVSHGATIDAHALLFAVVAGLDRWVRRLDQAGFGALREAWLARAEGLGGPVTVNLPGESFHGRVLDLDGTGALIVEDGDGRHRSILSGEVFFPGG